MATKPTDDHQDASSASTVKRIIKLISVEGQIFEIPESSAMLSITLKNFLEEDTGFCEFPVPNVKAETLTKVITYLNKYAGAEVWKKKKIAEDFLAGEELNTLLNLINAANYLEIEDLLEVTAQLIADAMKDLSVEEIRIIFNMSNEDEEGEAQEPRVVVKEDSEWA